jgi:NADPH-dependent 2,4-dienoyl-CoA reductase/sulfur reductase-like enzyme
MRRIAVIGASLAGVHAAEALRNRGFTGDLTLVSAEATVPYDRPPLSKELLTTGKAPEELALRPASWYEAQGITLRLGSTACGLDIDHGTVLLSDGVRLGFDGLVIATGATPRHLTSISNGAPLYALRTLDDAQALRARLSPGMHLVVIGAGFIGLEVASAARVRGAHATVVGAGPLPLSGTFGHEIGTWYQRLHERNQVRLICGTTVTSIANQGETCEVALSNGELLDADLVVVGIGARPAVQWLVDSGLKLNNGVCCTAELRTSAPNIVAAGDVAAWPNPIFGETMRVEHWTNAIEQGRHAAATLLGEPEPFASVPYFWTDQHQSKMRFVGRAPADAEISVHDLTDNRIVATFARDETIIGALCVGAPRALARFRGQIHAKAPMADAIETALAGTGD